MACPYCNLDHPAAPPTHTGEADLRPCIKALAEEILKLKAPAAEPELPPAAPLEPSPQE